VGAKDLSDAQVATPKVGDHASSSRMGDRLEAEHELVSTLNITTVIHAVHILCLMSCSPSRTQADAVTLAGFFWMLLL
jgi:hypothetical protein